MNFKRIVLTGGSGFIGSVIANRLSQCGVKLVIPVRRSSRAQHLFLLPTATVVEADIHDPATQIRLLSGADALINLAGIPHSRAGAPYGADFKRVHVELVGNLAQACRVAGVPRFIHVSALGAQENAPSEYLRSKAAGEALLQAGKDAPSWTILKPSVVFGPGDRFLNRFATYLRLSPVLPLACADSRLQPVYVGDVAETVLHCLRDNSTIEQSYELAGPNIYTLRQLVRYTAGLIGKRRWIAGLPDGLANVQAALVGMLPDPPLTRDNIRSLKANNIASAAPLPFGLTPTPLETVAPAYLGNETLRGRYFLLRSR